MLVEQEGFEPPRQKTAGLQPVTLPNGCLLQNLYQNIFLCTRLHSRGSPDLRNITWK